MLRRSPAAVALVALAAACAFVLLRLEVAADGDVTRFVVAGSDWTRPSAGVTVEQGPGYDGQFAFRTALAPYDLRRTAHGVTYDSPLRLQRLTYPALVFALAAGRGGAVPWVLVAVNVLALALLALLAATLARDCGRPAWAGLLLAAPTGVAITLGRDLTEIVAAALLVAGLLAWQRERPALAALAFTGAVLGRETLLLLYVAFAVAELLPRLRRGRVPGRTWVACAVPLVAFGALQLVCRQATGTLPLLASSGKNAVLPGTALLPAAAGWVRQAPHDLAALMALGQLAAVAVLVTAAALRLAAARAGERWAWAAALLLVLSLSHGVWRGPADLRTTTELQVLSGVVLLRSQGRLRPVVLPVLGACALTAVHRVLFL